MPTITTPEDIAAFRVGLCARSEWSTFDRNRTDGPQGRERYSYAEPSDKGRYLLAVLERFGGLPDAFEVLMNGFWRDVLIGLGATPVERNVSLRAELITTLRKRLNQRTDDLVFRSEEELERLAREAIRFGRKAGNEARFISYGALYNKWIGLVEDDLRTASHLKEEDANYYRDPVRLDRSIQHLCRQQILFQGREWQCRRCYDRNWVTVDGIGTMLKCGVCGQTQSAPVSGNWHFQANSFLLEAYREHGVEAIIWTPWQLWFLVARRSFYFAPSMWLWEQYPQNKQDGPTVEIDALAVVDGNLYLCEATTSAVLDRSQREQLVAAATRIRPDVLLLSTMDEPGSGLKEAVAELQRDIGNDTKVDLMEFRPEALDQRGVLPA